MAKTLKKSITAVKALERKSLVKIPRKESRKALAEENTLAKFSDAFAEMAERKRKEDAIATKLAKKRLPDEIAELVKFDIEHLFDLYDNALNGAYSNHELMKIMVKWKGAIKEEIISRIPVAKRKAK